MILIVGGAGYIGSHTNAYFAQKGYSTLVYDNLMYGHREALLAGEFVLGDLGDEAQLRLVFERYTIEAVIHFAAFTYVGESMSDPEKYYFNNVVNTLTLLRIMRQAHCRYIIFSSTCATYGDPLYLPLDEHHPQNPINPYGQSKLMVEQILRDYARAYDLRYVSLRYFNAAGAHAPIGESHDPETHLIPLVLQVALGTRETIHVFGTDYDTPDGSAVRDYIHVTDLAQAHLLALEYLKNGGESDVFNLGNGEGYSVLEVIASARAITEHPIPSTMSGRREGDPARLIANAHKAHTILGWSPSYPSLDAIIASAWEWERTRRF